MEQGSLNINNLNLSYNSKIILKDFSFSFLNNKSYAILGPSGSGKSSFLLSISSFFKGEESSSSFTIFGSDAQDIDKRRDFLGHGVSIMFQHPSLSLNPVYTLKEHVVRTLKLKNKKSRNDINTAIEEVLNFSSLKKDDLSLYPEEASGGMKRRFILSLVLLNKPSLLLLDEVTSELDRKNEALIANKLKKWKEENKATIIFTTHSPFLLESLADDFFILHDKVLEFCSSSLPLSPYSSSFLSSPFFKEDYV